MSSLVLSRVLPLRLAPEYLHPSSSSAFVRLYSVKRKTAKGKHESPPVPPSHTRLAKDPISNPPTTVQTGPKSAKAEKAKPAPPPRDPFTRDIIPHTDPAAKKAAEEWDARNRRLAEAEREDSAPKPWLLRKTYDERELKRRERERERVRERERAREKKKRDMARQEWNPRRTIHSTSNVGFSAGEGAPTLLDHTERPSQRAYAPEDAFRFGPPSGSGTGGRRRRAWSLDTVQPRAPDSPPTKIFNPLHDSANIELPPAAPADLPRAFAAHPLLPGLLTSLHAFLGPRMETTPIQALALSHLLTSHVGLADVERVAEDADDSGPARPHAWTETLLASETGSGKSIAYLLPVLQSLKLTEIVTSPTVLPEPTSEPREYNPRALILAPTHELSRQLSGFAKALCHVEKLRVSCASRANVRSGGAKRIADAVDGVFNGEEAGAASDGAKAKRDVDVLVGTPNRLLEMVHGRGWDWEARDRAQAEREGREGGRGAWKGKYMPAKPKVGLERVEWVVVDEADVLFDPDFQESTRRLLSDIASARGHPVPYTPANPTLSLSSASSTTAPAEIKYPFHLLLTTATIPSSLAAYLSTHHPRMVRLASPHLHHLPPGLKPEYVSWSGGNKVTDIEARLRKVWAEGAAKGDAQRSKVLVFCNRSRKVQELGAELAQRGIRNVALTSDSGSRAVGSNKHLAGFLRTKDPTTSPAHAPTDDVKAHHEHANDSPPDVLITTSLLSRGLDFSPQITHVFLVDEPRNMIDFLHRAGRTGRAGFAGRVVIFGKMKGRGSERGREVRRKVERLR